MPFGRKSPLEALAFPGVILAYKYSQYRQRRREAASRRVTERELSALHHKIDKLLSKLEESEPEPPTSQEDICVVCISARANMQTSPCGHRVVCRRCFVKTIQSAVATRLLPLRCVICRARVNRLTSTSGTTYRIQESASSYSMGAKSWNSSNSALAASASAYSMGDAQSGHHSFNYVMRTNNTHHYPRSTNSRVAQSTSLYSMSSTGSSSGISGMSHTSNYSKTSSISSGLCSTPSSPISPASTNSAYTPTTAAILNNHLAPPSASSSSGSAGASSSLSPSSSATSGSSADSPLSPREHQHSHRTGCPSGCSGAIPRKPLSTLSHSNSSTSSGISCGSFSPTAQTYPGRRYTKGRLVDLQNRLPPIKEFRSPAKVPHPSPVHISNPRFRYASYTKSSNETAPLLREPASPPKRPLNIQDSNSVILAPPPLKAGGARISPMTNKNPLPKNAYTSSAGKDKKTITTSKSISKLVTSTNSNSNGKSASTSASNNKKLTQDANANSTNQKTMFGGSNSAKAILQPQKQTNTSSSGGIYHTSRAFSLFSSSNRTEKADNKKNESVERKKKEEKLKLKAEKEARKEEKRLVKEEERLAKLIAKEEKKKGKKEAKELLIANDGNSKK